MDENMQTPQHAASAKKKMSKRTKWTIRIAAILLLILALLFTLYRCGVFDRGETPTVLIGAGVKEGTPAKPDNGSSSKEPGANGTEQFSIELNARPTFKDGNSEGNLGIVNPDVNLLSIEVEIRLSDTDEVIYRSGAIPPNHYIDNDKLSKVLNKGEHKATAYVSMLNPDSPDQQFNRAKFDLVIVIEN